MIIIGFILFVFAFFMFLVGDKDSSAVRGTMFWTLSSGLLVSGSIFIVGGVIRGTIKNCLDGMKQKWKKDNDKKLPEF